MNTSAAGILFGFVFVTDFDWGGMEPNRKMSSLWDKKMNDCAKQKTSEQLYWQNVTEGVDATIGEYL